MMTPTSFNNRFVALWNDGGLYLQHQVDYGFWISAAFP